ncbi:hypothetical protein ILYODFUR_033611 [Ilyodon furcidens]|uniref:EF-hand domain-containing protein n=1 Tax=Ilyodon furcidens TaxID=33524 RepID=A0ABV0T2M1_9TELE
MAFSCNLAINNETNRSRFGGVSRRWGTCDVVLVRPVRPSTQSSSSCSGSVRFCRTLMIQQQGTRLLAGVFCQCRSAETHAGVDPGGGCGPPPSACPQLASQDSRPGSEILDHPCDMCGGPEQEHRLKVLFQILDVNGDGGICVNDLTIGLKKLGVHRTEHELRVRGRVRVVGQRVLFGAERVVL